MHADLLPGVPLQRATPSYIWGHSIWAYIAGFVYLFGGVLLLIGKKTRVAATWVGLAVFFVELVVYLPIAVVDRASLGNGFNYMADTLMFCGAVFLLAAAMPREEAQPRRFLLLRRMRLDAGSRSTPRIFHAPDSRFITAVICPSSLSGLPCSL